jgi:hypothetical protein
MRLLRYRRLWTVLRIRRRVEKCRVMLYVCMYRICCPSMELIPRSPDLSPSMDLHTKKGFVVVRPSQFPPRHRQVKMTFSTLRALQAIIGDAIDEIHAIYASRLGSPPPSPISSSSSSSSTPPPSPPKQHRSPTPPLLSLSNNTLSSASHYSSSNTTPLPSSVYDAPLDFPDLDLPGDPSSPAEQLTSRPDVANAISRIVAAASQIAVVVRSPFLTICDASMIVRPVRRLFASLRYNFSKSIISPRAYASLRHLTSQSSLALPGLQVYLS